MMGAAAYASSHHIGVGFSSSSYIQGVPYKFDEDGNVIDEDEEENAPRVIGSVGWWDESRGIVVSRIEVDDSDHYIRFYGWPTDPGWSCDERRIDDIEIRDLDFIIDCIPETDEVSDVTLK